MGSPLGPTLANVFLCHNEEEWLQKCPKQFSPSYYNRFMDDTFLLFSSQDKIKKFHKYINSRHKNMTFTYEIEKDNSLPFLDILVSRENNIFSTAIYRKPTFSGLYSNFDSFMPEDYKKGLIKTLLHRAFVLCIDWNHFHQEVLFLKDIFRKNRYPSNFIEKCTKQFLDKLFVMKKCVTTVPKKPCFITLPYLGTQSLSMRKQLTKLMETYYPQCKLNIVFRSNNRLKNYFMFKDKIPRAIRSNLLYRFTCNRCKSVYIGKTRRHFLVRVNEHLGISLRTGKTFSFNNNNKNNSAVLTHINTKCCNQNTSIENFAIIGSAKTDLHLCIKESLLIQKIKPILNNTVQSTPLKLFD